MNLASLASKILSIFRGTNSLGAEDGNGVGVPFTIRLAYNGAAGTKPKLFPNTSGFHPPFPMRILEVEMYVTANSAHTNKIQATDGGTDLTDAMSGAATGVVRTNYTLGTPTLAVTDVPIFLLGNGAQQGQLVLTCVKV